VRPKGEEGVFVRRRRGSTAKLDEREGEKEESLWVTKCREEGFQVKRKRSTEETKRASVVTSVFFLEMKGGRGGAFVRSATRG